MIRRRHAVVAPAVALFLAACGPSNKALVRHDYAEGQVVDLSVTRKVSGTHDLFFFSIPKETPFLDGYLQGIITDYQDHPIQGVVVRAVASGEAEVESGEASPGFNVSSFDPGVSDTNGVYRIRFSFPILDGIVDLRGKLLFNPGWEQEKTELGRAYEPQLKESPFHFYYNEKKGTVIFDQGIRKTIVAPAINPGGAKMAALPGAQPPAEEKAPKPKEKPKAAAADAGDAQDLFKGFGFGP
jgi:hypothetical protein